MGRNPLSDLEQSACDLARVVLPTLERRCPAFQGSTCHVIEGHFPHQRTSLARDLDVLAGIDAYQRLPFAIRGIASRIQYQTNYQTFTIRLARPGRERRLTEYHKRRWALLHKNDGYFFPFWTLQAYLTHPGGSLLSLAVAKTEQLYTQLATAKEHYKKRDTPHALKGRGFSLVLSLPPSYTGMGTIPHPCGGCHNSNYWT